MEKEQMRKWKNGGGSVSKFATVEDGVFIGPGSEVYGTVTGESVILEGSIVSGCVVDSFVCGSVIQGKVIGSVVRGGSSVGVAAFVSNSEIDGSRIERFGSVVGCEVTGSLIRDQISGEKLAGKILG